MRPSASRCSVSTIAVCFAVGAAAVMAGCTYETNAAGSLPPGVTVGVSQSRSGSAAGELEVAVANGANQALTVTALTLKSGQFESPAIWPKESTTIRSGVTASLRVPLPAADCSSADPTPSVVLRFRLPGEKEQVATVRPTDTLDQLGPIRAAECLARDVGERVVITANREPKMATSVGAATATLELDVTPTGRGGSVTVVAARVTTLFSLVEATSGARSDRMPLDITFESTGSPAVLTLNLVPGRCDGHAIAEDKLGTVFPLEVLLEDGTSGVVRITSTSAVRAALFDFVALACS